MFNKEEIRNRILEMAEPEFAKFQRPLMPTVDPERVVGVRIPKLRALAKEIMKAGGADDFLADLPHKYFEEDNVHAFMIEQVKDCGEVFSLLEEFLPYVNNWSTSDSMKPKVFKKHLPELEERIKVWLNSTEPYTVRFGIEMYMSFFLDEAFSKEQMDAVCKIRFEHYYVKMMQAWYMATALAKQYDVAVKYIEEKKLDQWTHNKSIQKAKESFRVSDERKKYLNSLKL